MLYCQDCVDLMADFIEGRLPAEQKAKLEEHLSYCPPCVTFVRTYKATVRVSKKALAAEMPEEMSARLHDFMAAKLAAKKA